MFRYTVLLTFLFLVFSTTCHAADYGFETTSEGITKGLLAPEQKRDEGSLKDQGWQSLSTTDLSREKTRTVKILRNRDGVEVWETVAAPRERRGGFVNLKIGFDVNSSFIRPESLRVLDELGKALVGPDLEHLAVYINGHTDSDGAEKYNLRLSLKRASAVKKYLIQHYPIAPGRLKVVGYGESMPLKPNTSAENKQLNRRVEVVAAERN